MVNKTTKNTLNGIIMLIGIVMIYIGWTASLLAPALSGIAFILIGINHCDLLDNKKSKK